MVIEFSLGKIIATQREIVIKLSGNGMVTMQAQTDAIQLIGRGANVVLAHGAESKWSIKLDDEDQLHQLAQEIGIDIQ
ncbi:DUF3389 domain-containing protein [Vibrio rotiferianus]|uniref:DUF3389 domain-containing protein n=1 Tax=Vibrio rotiferianus TaxID=190895 RepID=UPI00111074B6|nr:DUF3389 domain-containing protein [Vibrio rotiferianus]TMX56404.1 DUF3389 domain-containing protein [Vibrio rotiferianus]